MTKKMTKWLWGTSAVLAGVGGLVHALQGGFGFNLLVLFNGAGRVIQTLAGVATVAFVIHWFGNKK